MQLKKLFKEENAVSPVIGVILMVAITVILAAVIATFVLGLGEQVSDTSPNASFNFDYNDTEPSGAEDSFGVDPSEIDADGTLTIRHSGGPNIKTSLLSASGSTINTGYDNEYSSFQNATDEGNLGERMGAGDRVQIFINDDDSISVVWNSEDGSTSATLQTFDGPDA